MTSQSTNARFQTELANRLKLYRDGEMLLGAIRVGETLQSWRLESPATKYYLQSLHYELTGRPLTKFALIDTKSLLEARARHDGLPCKVGSRFMRKGGNAYLDLCSADWKAVEITAEGWQVVQPQEPLFYRTGGMEPLPLPVQGGTWAEFWNFLNIPEHERLLVRAWLATALLAGMQVPLLALHGEQGSAKSTTSRTLRYLIDPHKSLLRSLPPKEHDLFVSANCNAVMVFDNMSGLRTAMSDAICKLVTGGAYIARKLYSDGEEFCIEAKRAVIINGIDDLAMRQDLISRAVVIEMPTIPDDERQSEDAFNLKLQEARPHLLGLILNDVQMALRFLPLVEEKELPRMTEYTRVGIALANAEGLAEGTFQNAYKANQAAAIEAGLSSEPVVEALERLLVRTLHYKGRMAELYRELGAEMDDTLKLGNGWPKAVHHLSSKLKRLQPALKQRGITLAFHRKPDAQWVHIQKNGAHGAYFPIIFEGGEFDA